jgi:uncharacterized protein (DUF302 family)
MPSPARQVAHLARRITLCLAVAVAPGATPLGAQERDAIAGMVTLASDADFGTTLARVEPAVKARGLFLMRVMDHAAAAAQFGRTIPPNTLVLFGTPATGSRLMACAPRAGIDLPQKLLLFEEDGAVRVAYNDPAYLVRRHRIEGCDAEIREVAGNLAAVAREVAGGAEGE